MVGNDNADVGATRGCGEHFPGLLGLATWLAQKHDDYCAFMKRVHRYMIAVSQKEKEIRDEMVKEEKLNLNLKKNQKPLRPVQHCIPQQRGCIKQN